MEKTIENVPAFRDSRTQEAMRLSLENLATQVGRRQVDLRESITQLRSESPLLIQTLDSSVEPTPQPGMLWFVQNDGLVYYYDYDALTWLAASVTSYGGNNAVSSIGASNYAINYVVVPAKTYVTRAIVGFVSTTGISGTINVTQLGGGTLGSKAFSFGVSIFSEIEVAINNKFVAATGIRIEVALTTGSLPATTSLVEARRVCRVQAR